MQNVHVILAAPKETKIKPLIQSQGLVIGVDRGALIAIEEGLVLDIALGDFDSISKDEKKRVEQYAKEVINFPAKKDDTDAELALLYVSNNLKTENIYFYNWQGGRMDHLYSLLMTVLQERFLPLVSKIKFVSVDNYISHYLAGKHVLRKKEGMDYLSFILLTDVEKLTLSEVSYPLKEINFDSPRALISNQFLSDTASFSFSKGIVAVIQSRDANKNTK